MAFLLVRDVISLRAWLCTCCMSHRSA